MSTPKVILEFSLCVMKDIKSFLELFQAERYEKLGNMLPLLEIVAGANILQVNSSTSKLLKLHLQNQQICCLNLQLIIIIIIIIIISLFNVDVS